MAEQAFPQVWWIELSAAPMLSLMSFWVLSLYLHSASYFFTGFKGTPSLLKLRYLHLATFLEIEQLKSCHYQPTFYYHFYAYSWLEKFQIVLDLLFRLSAWDSCRCSTRFECSLTAILGSAVGKGVDSNEGHACEEDGSELGKAGMICKSSKITWLEL